MKEHQNILEQLAENKLPDVVNQESCPSLEIFTELYKAGHIEAIDIGSFDGAAYMEPKITLSGRGLLAQLRAPKKEDTPSSIHIGSISGGTFQVGNGNALTVNLTIQDVVEQVAKSDDQEAKSILKELFNNATVATLLGAGASALMTLL